MGRGGRGRRAHAGGRAAGGRPRAHRHRRRTRRTCSCAWCCATRRARWPRRRPTRCATASTRRCTRAPRTSGRRRAGLERLLAPVRRDRVGVEVADLRVALRRVERHGAAAAAARCPGARRRSRARGRRPRARRSSARATPRRRAPGTTYMRLISAASGAMRLMPPRAHRLARRGSRRGRCRPAARSPPASRSACGRPRCRRRARSSRRPSRRAARWPAASARVHAAGSRSALRYRRAPPMPRDWTDLFITGDGGAVAAPRPRRARAAPRLLPPPAREPVQDARGARRRDPGHAVRGRRSTSETWERLEEALIMADVGARDDRRGRRASSRWRPRPAASRAARRCRRRLTELLADLAAAAARAASTCTHEPTVIMVAGVNGTGKTTTIGKLAWHLQRELGKTRRARRGRHLPRRRGRAARRAGRSAPAARSSPGPEGSDPGSVAFEAVTPGPRARAPTSSSSTPPGACTPRTT